MRAAIISVGSELLLGQIVDTNASHLARTLAGLGVDLYYKFTVGDNRERIQQVLRDAVARADLILMTGGLGPTDDDLTKEAVADALGLDLVNDPDVEARLRERAAQRGRPVSASMLKQALVPRGARIIANQWGSAPGLIVDHGGGTIIMMPGVPREMYGMVEHGVVPYLRERGWIDARMIRSRVMRIAGLGEALAAERVRDLLGGSNPTVAPLAHTGEAHLRITAKGTEDEIARLLDEAEARIRERLGDAVFGTDDEAMEVVVVRLLGRHHLTLAVAESCTGGLMAHRLTNVPGASKVFIEGVVAYSNHGKTTLLDVPAEVIERHGAVSAEVARAMAEGVRRRAGSALALAETGIAGPPQGAHSPKPVGLVYLALANAQGVRVEEHRFGAEAGREATKQLAAQAALNMVRLYILRNAG
ncbi:MAG: competence/damage-inducible protein A [Armatimonadetes bacterium]|nr:competence/damage-inducible protein A [Armatimonadota bacterium]